MSDIKQNYDWADVAKGIGIILVVLGHAIEYCNSAGGVSLFVVENDI